MNQYENYPNILFCGDPHGRFEVINQVAERVQPDAIVLLGDMTAEEPLSHAVAGALDVCPVMWIIGNHDTDSPTYYANLFEDPGHDRLINIDERVYTLQVPGKSSIRIAGLGGVFRGKIWDAKAPLSNGMTRQTLLNTCGKGNLWKGGIPLRHRSTIFPCAYEKLQAQQADVLVTHEGPGFRKHGFDVIDKLARTMGCQYLFHGHHHKSGRYDSTGLNCYCVGIGAIISMSGTMLAKDGWQSCETPESCSDYKYGK